MAPSMKDFIKKAAQAAPLDHVIIVGGFSESKYIFDETSNIILQTYEDAKKLNKALKATVQIDMILSRSLAIIKGGKELFKLELITPPRNIALPSINIQV